jgi:predicted metal-dependent enzyme (double-stranded beta helix superfamily)
MGQTIEQFGGRCHDILKQNPGPEGLEQVRQGLEQVLGDPDILATHLGPDADAPRKIIYEDAELKFCILAHVFKGANESPPHDHGPTWAIYGQAGGTTEMTEYRVVEAPEDGKPGTVEAFKSYELAPGMAVAYEAGQVHSPKRTGETRLIRIEGVNVTTVKRTPYELV